MAAVHVVVLILCLQVFHLTAPQGVDLTREPGASGTDVVRAVVNRIQAVFGADNQFLRRIAYVESRDGTDLDTYRSGYHGGIWQVDESAFRDTQDFTSHPELLAKYEMIRMEFGIDWLQAVQWMDLRKPLYSGIAARLFISNIPSEIPCDIAGQGNYWADLYNRTGQQQFIDDIEGLGCKLRFELGDSLGQPRGGPTCVGQR